MSKNWYLAAIIIYPLIKVNMKVSNIIFSVVILFFIISCTNNETSEATQTNSKYEILDNSNKPVDQNNKKATSPAGTYAEHLTQSDFLQKVMDYKSNPSSWNYKGDKPCIIDFYADWCAPCRKVAPVLEELAKEYDGQIYVYKVNTQHEKELAAAFRIQSIPAFLFCPLKGDPQMSNGIARTNEETKKMFKKIIDEVLLASK